MCLGRDPLMCGDIFFSRHVQETKASMREMDLERNLREENITSGDILTFQKANPGWGHIACILLCLSMSVEAGDELQIFLSFSTLLDALSW